MKSREDPGRGKTGRQEGLMRALPQGHCSGAAVPGRSRRWAGGQGDHEQPSRARPRAYHPLGAEEDEAGPSFRQRVTNSPNQPVTEELAEGSLT